MEYKKLEEIFWDGDRFRKSNGVWVVGKSISEPVSINLPFGDKELINKKVEEYINKCIPKTSMEYLEANAYCVGTPTNNDNGSPIQLYKITFKSTDFKKKKYRNINSRKEFLEILKDII